jgi:hypothetical protein
MDPLNSVILLALLATVAALGVGLASMAHGGVFDERHSTQLMFVRVGAQAVTFVLLLVAIYLASAG